MLKCIPSYSCSLSSAAVKLWRRWKCCRHSPRCCTCRTFPVRSMWSPCLSSRTSSARERSKPLARRCQANGESISLSLSKSSQLQLSLITLSLCLSQRLHWHQEAVGPHRYGTTNGTLAPCHQVSLQDGGGGRPRHGGALSSSRRNKYKSKT